MIDFDATDSVPSGGAGLETLRVARSVSRFNLTAVVLTGPTGDTTLAGAGGGR